MNYDRSERIRRVAVLVASLEETLAQQMLDALPRLEAVKILAEVERLGELDPEEQQDVLEEFRRAGRRERSPENAVEFTYSAPQAAMAVGTSSAAADLNARDAADHVGDTSDADAVLMAELLLPEHPQTIAAALSRLSEDQAAAVFAALPAAIQAEVVERLVNLQPADEDSVQDLQTQLEQRVQQHRVRRQRAAAGTELARRILAKTAPAQQVALLARLSPAGASTFTASDSASAASSEFAPVAHQAQMLANAVQRARAGSESGLELSGGSEAWTDGDHGSREFAATEAYSTEDLADRSHDLESLSDSSLLDALRVADEQTVQRALAASSEHFLHRIASKLPRRQAARLRKVVRSLGPTRLAELRTAQHELLRIARHCEDAGVAAR